MPSQLHSIGAAGARGAVAEASSSGSIVIRDAITSVAKNTATITVTMIAVKADSLRARLAITAAKGKIAAMMAITVPSLLYTRTSAKLQSFLRLYNTTDFPYANRHA